MRVWLFSLAAVALGAPVLAEGTSYPCEFGVISQTAPVTYDGQQRNNPDGTYYPGDAFHYTVKYPNLGSCFRPVVHEPAHSDSLVLGSHAYEDAGSLVDFGDAASSYCGSDRCLAGHAELALFAGYGSENVGFSAGGWRVICHSRDDGESCSYTWIHRESFFSIDIADPQMALRTEKIFVNDSDGYNATNLDGTYYMWDPIIVHSMPSYNWQSERTKTLFVEYEKAAELRTVHNISCVSVYCLWNLSIPGFMDSRHGAFYGHDITAYNATERHMVRDQTISHNAKLLSVSGGEITSKRRAINAQVVPYEPVFQTYPYLVLGDGQPASWDNRHGIAVFYGGSKGEGVDGELVVHNMRRSKISGFSSAVTAVKTGEIVPVSADAIWAGTYGMDPNGEGYCTKTRFGPNAVESKGLKTAMFIHSGYGSVTFDLPVSGIMKDPLYSEARINGSVSSVGFAGANSTEVFNYTYAYPDVLFGNNVSLTAVDPNGDVIHNVPVSIQVLPNLKMSGVAYTHDYVCDKVEFDSGQEKFGDVVLADMYPKNAYASSFGSVTLYLQRISTWNVYNLDDFLSAPIGEGYGSPSPYVMRFSAGEKTITDAFSYAHADSRAYVANQNTDNVLYIEDGRAGVLVRGPHGFGHITYVTVDGAGHSVRTNCLDTCTIPTPKNSTLIEAYNAWGGRAYGSYEPITVEKSGLYIPNPYTVAVIGAGSVVGWYAIRQILGMYRTYHNT